MLPAMQILATILLFLVVAGGPNPVGPPDPRPGLEKSKRAIVMEVQDGDTVVLADRTRVRLVGIQTPKRAFGRKGVPSWPLARQSKDTLSRLLLDKYVTLYHGGATPDRYGRPLAHLFRDDGLWIQGAMLESGMARVYSFPDNRALVTEMLQLEKTARDQRRGIWALDYYQPRDHGVSHEYRNSFQLVTGRVHNVAKIRSTYYLNFEEDWRQDFTIVIKAHAARLFQKTDMAPESLEGKKNEVRGWLKMYNGPMIEATHPEQIAIID